MCARKFLLGLENYCWEVFVKLSLLCVPDIVRKTRNFSQRWLMVTAALLVLVSLPAFAQEGTIIGTVTDPSGAAVP